MEIEKKYIPKYIPDNIDSCEKHHIEQGYLSTNPVVRVRKSDEEYYLTYKGGGMMAREEYNLPLSKESYEHLIAKADGNIISKTRYLFPLDSGLTAELDIFEGVFLGLFLIEVEFSSIEEAENFIPPEWFGEEVTYDKKYHNSYLSKIQISKE